MVNKIDARYGEEYEEIRREVFAEIKADNPFLREATEDQFVTMLDEERDVCAIVIAMKWDDIEDFSSLSGVSFGLSFPDSMSLKDVEDVIISYAGTIMRKRGVLG